MAIYVLKNNEKRGPYEEPVVARGLKDGTYSSDDLAWRDGMSEWQPLSAISLSLSETSNQVSALMKRYKDAYLVARVTDQFGEAIKLIGAAVAILLILGGVVINSQGGDTMFAISVITGVVGVVIGLLFYLLGVLVSAQGQILKASLDGAVNSSPFLDNKHRAKIMSLPEAQ